MRLLSLIIAVICLSIGNVSATEKVFFYTTDPAGSPVAMTDSTGNVVWRADYKPFGQEQSISGTLENNERFIGKEKDKETGLDYFGARYMYDKVGRFTSPDPVGPVDPWTSKTNHAMLLNPQRLNPYAYGLNNPYRYVDPDGKAAVDASGFMAMRQQLLGWAPQWLREILMPTDPSIGPMAMESGGGKIAANALKNTVGKSVLGQYPEYLQLADQVSARRFNIPSEVWNRMAEGERWAANQKFLDRMINRGDEIILSNPVKNINDVTGSFRKELDYLTGKGFRVSEDGSRMVK